MKRILPMLALVPLAVVVWLVVDSAQPSTRLHALERTRLERPFAPRLSISTHYHACAATSASGDRPVPDEACGTNGDAPPEVEQLAAVPMGLDPDALQAAALTSVIWWDSVPASLNDAIANLSNALRVAADPVPLLVDLSAVHLVRAERTQNSSDLLAALENANQALEIEPRNLSALFNAALALDAFGLDEQAVLAWDAYLTADRASPWAAEARGRRRAVAERLARAVPPPRPQTSWTPAQVDRFAAGNSQQARLFGWDHALGEWGSAWLRGNSAQADSFLLLAERLGNALAARRGGDATLADAVQAIRDAQNDAAQTRTLARAHRAYAAGIALFRGSGHDAALDSIALVLALQPPSPALLGWASAFNAGALTYLQDYQAAEDSLRALLSRTDSVRHPALVARASWMLGTTVLRQGDSRSPRHLYRTAGNMFESIGETEHAATMRHMEGQQVHADGDAAAGYRAMHEALLVLRRHRESVWLHGLLLELAFYSAQDGMRAAALSLQREDLAVAVRVSGPTALPEALLNRARARAILGQADSAARDVDSVIVLLEKVPREHQKWFGSNRAYTVAVVRPGPVDAAFAAELDSAVAYFRKENSNWLLPTLMRRADVRLAAGNRAGAFSDLDSIATLVRTMSPVEFHLHSAVMERTRSRFDSLVMMHVRAGEPLQALTALERGRISFARYGGAGTAAPARIQAPPGETVLEYALIGNALLTWVVGRDSVTLLRRTVNRDSLLLSIGRSVAALESGSDELAQPDLERLYEWLVRPVQSRLGAPETPLAIIADGEIAGVPFNALWDARRRRHLLRDHPLRFPASLADAAQAAPPATADGVLLIANPAFDRDEYRGLRRLTWANVEAVSLMRLYPGAHVLRDGDATVDSLRARASGASLIHYAGHAFFDDARPEQSFLVLAGEGRTGRLTAESAGALDLRGTRLVVLSACRTLRVRGGRSGGFAGFTGALLSAGAGGVIGSLWEVDDAPTQRLMAAFHAGYAVSGDPVRALRQAQLHLLDSDDAALASPSAWAGFRYAGR
ncbi:MAG TPA: CHAT domain-containing protein [Longimicrobium sp.]